MPETPRTEPERIRLDGYTAQQAAPWLLFLIAEMLERIAIALEKEEKDA